jgi:hypothetical protein
VSGMDLIQGCGDVVAFVEKRGSPDLVAGSPDDPRPPA